MSKPNSVSGDTPLTQILAKTRLSVHPASFVLVGLPPAQQPAVEQLLPTLGADFVQYIREPDVLTLLLPQPDWQAVQHRFPSAMVEGPLKIFTFTVAMDWQVVGFLAAVTGWLAQNGIPLGAVCGYYRDHLFIAGTYAAQAEQLLREKLAESRRLSGD
ncbi:MAG: ACT domain-containing protein [Anaerolineae bacterium]